MSKGGSNNYMLLPQASTQQQSSQQTQTLPEWLQKSADFNINRAQQLAQQATPQYSGEVSPDLQPFQQLGGLSIADNYGRYQRPNDLAIGAAAAGLGPVYANSLANVAQNGGLDAYSNPYQSTVINNLRAQSQQNLGNALNSERDGALKSGAAYGSRHAVRDGVATALANQELNSQIGAMLQNQFDKSMGYAAQDINNQYSAANANRAALQQGSQNLSSAASAGQNSATADANALLTYGNLQQQTQAAKDAGNLQLWQYYNQFPYMQQETLNQTMAATPKPVNSTSSGTTSNQSWGQYQNSTTSPIMSGLGAAASLAGNLGRLGEGASGLMTLGSGLMAMLPSDEKLKKDIEHLGKDALSGLPIKAYRWKGEPKNAKKTVGPIAQDVQKVEPQNVKRVGGKLHVNSLAGRGVMPRYAGRTVAQAKKGLLG